MKRLIALLLLPLSMAYPFTTVIGPGYGQGVYHDNTFAYHQTPWQHGSGVYNHNRFGYQTGHNPFYLRYAGTSDHVFIRNTLDYQHYRNPALLRPRASTNPGRGTWRY
jgi:hypothetical protein